ncbi:MAG TPA: HAD family phosphatase [Solirubrobacterales bacterium]|nr:HAD family phosphatase [Solirubrobacterales bacterium]
MGRSDAIDAVVFDLDGVLVDSEAVWDEVRKEFVEENGGRWHDGAQRDMMGMSSVEWSEYVRDRLGVDMDPERISQEVADRVADLYREHLPLLPGAVESVRALAAEWPLGLASSSNRHVIDLVLDEAGIADCFQATVSSEEVRAGKPAPDVYLEAARRLDADPSSCLAIEDSTNGIRSGHAAEMTVIAVPNRDFPPEADALALAAQVLDSLDELTPERVRSLVTA